VFMCLFIGFVPFISFYFDVIFVFEIVVSIDGEGIW
jgi:hypothetical protein